MLPILLFMLGTPLAAESPSGYFRFPALHRDQIIFTAEGDLWKVSIDGGRARRLTSHPGEELHAAISPDGRKVAFTAEYEGPREVYSMPIEGGLPKRHTYDDGAVSVAGWTPEGQILYSTYTFSTLPNAQLARLDPASNARLVLPLSQASEGVFNRQGNTLYFTRLPFQGSSTKRYQGGTAQNLWRFTFGEPEAVALTADFAGTSKQPMWWRGRVYFLSDRDGTMNLWSMKSSGEDLVQRTHHQGWDIKSASLSRGRIVYAQGADLRLFDLRDGTDSAVAVQLASDFDQARERWIDKPLEYLTSAHLSPNGDRVALTARGQIFVAPLKPGRLAEVPRPPGVRYRDARFMPDGKSLAALSDETGELEFWKVPANGVGSPEQLTSDGKVFRFDGLPSPDGKWLAYQDKSQKLWTLQVGTRKSTLVAESLENAFRDLAWSPDSAWLAYVETAANSYQQIHLHKAGEGTRLTVTSDRVNSFSPAWSPDGQWLYFLSERHLRSLVPSPWGPRQPDPFFTEVTKVYQVGLLSNLRSPFDPPNELESADSKAPPPSGAPTNQTSRISIRIEAAGLPERVREVPLPAGNYDSLSATDKHLLWISRDTSFAGKRHLQQLAISNDRPKVKTLVEAVDSYELSADGKKLLVRKDNSFYVIPPDAAAPAKLDETKLDLSGWTFSIQPREEWRQIFVESWRMMRDYFYDRGMHGLDWRATLNKYLPLVDRVSDRGELSDLIAEMVGELSALHIYVRYGDEREGPDQIKTAALGAAFERDLAAGGWRVTRIYQSDPDYPGAKSPLARPGVDLQTGTVILAVNGVSTLAAPHLEALLRHQVGKQVLLEVKTPGAEASRQIIVEPMSNSQEAELRYHEWEYTRRLLVEKLSDGKIGYVHLRAMGSANIAEWARDFYPVFNRPGLIIDVRHNRGGNIDSWILGKLLRKAWFYWQPRVGNPYWNMQYAFRGHMTLLCNERTASDGEAFAEGFRRLGLGKVIGTRTWGGEIWLSARRWLVDSGMATAAEYGVYGPEGEWLIEGHGVDPDIVVDNLPHATFNGEDAQLQAAVEHLLALIKEDPRPVPPAPPYPDKSAP